MDNTMMQMKNYEHAPHRQWLFEWQTVRQHQIYAYEKQTGKKGVKTNSDFERDHPDFPYYTARPPSWHSESAKREQLHFHPASEHIYPITMAERTSEDGQSMRGYTYGEFVTSMLTAFAFTLNPSIQIMARQLEVHWSSEIEDEAIERERIAARDRLLKAQPNYDNWLAWDPAWAAVEELRGVRAREANPVIQSPGGGVGPKEDGAAGRKETALTMRAQGKSSKHSHADSASHELFLSALPQCYTPADYPRDIPKEARHPDMVALSPEEALSPVAPLGFTSSLHQSSFGTLHPMAAVAIRRGDKMAEDGFYLSHGHFRPVSMFIWRLYLDEHKHTMHRRKQWEQDIQNEAVLAKSENRPPAPAPPRPARFRYNSLFVLTDDVPAFEEIQACASLPKVEVRDDEHWDQLVLEAAEKERKLTAEQTRLGRIELDKKGGKVVMDSDAIFQNPPPPPKGEAGCTSPVNRLLLPGVKIIYNVFAPQRCYHPFVRVGFQQFLVSRADARDRPMQHAPSIPLTSQWSTLAITTPPAGEP
jgi:hypothetical protein